MTSPNQSAGPPPDSPSSPPLAEAPVGLRRVYATTNLNSLQDFPQATDSSDLVLDPANIPTEDSSVEHEHHPASQANNQPTGASLFWNAEPGWSFANIRGVAVDPAPDSQNPLPVQANTQVTGSLFFWTPVASSASGNIPGLALNFAPDLPNSLPAQIQPNSFTSQNLPSPQSQVHLNSASTQDHRESPALAQGSQHTSSTPDLASSLPSEERSTSPATPRVVNPLFPRRGQVTRAQQPNDVILTRRLRHPARRAFTATPIPVIQDGARRCATDSQVTGVPRLRRVCRSGSLRSLARSQAEADEAEATTTASEEAEEEDGAPAQEEWRAPEDYVSSGEEDEDEGGRVNLDEVDAPVAEQLRAGLAHLGEARVEIDVLDGDLPVGAVRGNPAAIRARADLVHAEGEILEAVGQLWRSLAEAREVAVDAQAGFRQLQDEVRRLTTEYLAAQIEVALLREQLRDEQ